MARMIQNRVKQALEVTEAADCDEMETDRH